jgi:hypothetical protein
MYLYSVYPTIWKRSSMMTFVELFPTKTYREIENGDVQAYVSTLKNYYVWNINTSIPMGCSTELTPPVIKYRHFIVAGKWIIKWNQKEILNICKEYNINLHNRGIHDIQCYNMNLQPCYQKYKTNHICSGETVGSPTTHPLVG